jgi:hypothetical protein
MNCLCIAKRAQTDAALVAGIGINSKVRMSWVAKQSIRRMVEHMGRTCAVYHHRHVRNFDGFSNCKKIGNHAMVAGISNQVGSLEEPGGFLGVPEMVTK